MVQLQILSGQTAGDVHVVRHFPFCIGRDTGNELTLADEGVWHRHLTLEFQKEQGILLHTSDHAFAAVNEEPQTSVRLCNGDIISFGSVKIQFWLAAPRQRALRLRELSFWLLLAAVTSFQFFLIYRLLR